jgi:S1-C subfamily serine protease
MAFRSIAEQGYAPAQYELAMLYHYGYGVSKDYKAAIRWYRKAANQGHRISQNMLAALAEGNQPPRSRQARKSPRPSPARRSDPNKIVSASSGTGFAVSSNGHVITNHHVIEGCQKVRIHHKGKSIPATVVTFDPRNDLALLKGDFRPSTVFSLSNASPELLQDVYVAGFPFGRKVSTSVKVTKGIISSLTGIGNNFSNIQIDAALQSGNSGGPILDEKGNVVGVAVARLDKMYALKNYGSLPENTNFGIKTNVVRSILESSNV